MRAWSLFLLIFSYSVFATQNERLMNIVDTFSRTPASLSGNISIASRLNLGEEMVDIGPFHARAAVNWKENAPINFNITENELTLNTRGAFSLKLAGVNLRINSIGYNKDGHFHVDMSSPVMEKSLEARVAQAIETKFKAKMDQALRELTLIRRQRTGREARSVIDGIIKIFAGPVRPGLNIGNVQMSGDVRLNFDFPANQTLNLNDQFVAEIKAEDSISAGGSFTRIGGRYNINQIEFNSSKGVTFHSIEGSEQSMSSLRVLQIVISDRGIEPTMVSGAEETITGIRQLIGLISTAQGVSSLGAPPNCDPRIAEIQSYVRRKFRGELAPLVRQNREVLLRAGINPEIISALER